MSLSCPRCTKARRKALSDSMCEASIDGTYVGRIEVEGGVSGDFRETARVAESDRAAGGEGLEDRQAEAFVEGRIDEDGGMPVEKHQLPVARREYSCSGPPVRSLLIRSSSVRVKPFSLTQTRWRSGRRRRGSRRPEKIGRSSCSGDCARRRTGRSCAGTASASLSPVRELAEMDHLDLFRIDLQIPHDVRPRGGGERDDPGRRAGQQRLVLSGLVSRAEVFRIDLVDHVVDRQHEGLSLQMIEKVGIVVGRMEEVEILTPQLLDARPLVEPGSRLAQGPFDELPGQPRPPHAVEEARAGARRTKVFVVGMEPRQPGRRQPPASQRQDQLVKIARDAPSNLSVHRLVVEENAHGSHPPGPASGQVPRCNRSCSAGEKMRPRMSSVPASEVSPEAAKIIVSTTNW